MSAKLDWQEVSATLASLTRVRGGFSTAERGLVTLPNGRQIFVKIGTDDNTRAWAKKEIAVYRFLQEVHYPHIPQLLAVNDDETAFALEALGQEDGWDWSETWTKERLDATLAAMDTLASIVPTGDAKAFFENPAIAATDDGWRPLADDKGRQQMLLTKVRKAGYDAIADSLDFEAMAKQSGAYVFANDLLVHNDVRADNGAWNARLGQVKLVDWNWTQLGDRRTDLAATLTHVQKCGFDVLRDYASRLDGDALQWMAGFWFDASIKPIWPGGPAHLRDHQLVAGVMALTLSKQ